jgi:putative membrane protein
VKLRERYAMDKRLKLISKAIVICSSFYLIYTLTGCGPMFGPRGRMDPGMMVPWGMGWFGIIVVILIQILVIGALIFLLPRLKQNYKIGGVETSSGKSKALEILEERYARGEIDKTEFEEKKKDLL